MAYGHLSFQVNKYLSCPASVSHPTLGLWEGHVWKFLGFFCLFVRWNTLSLVKKSISYQNNSSHRWFSGWQGSRRQCKGAGGGSATRSDELSQDLSVRSPWEGGSAQKCVSKWEFSEGSGCEWLQVRIDSSYLLTLTTCHITIMFISLFNERGERLQISSKTCRGSQRSQACREYLFKVCLTSG